MNQVTGHIIDIREKKIFNGIIKFEGKRIVSIADQGTIRAEFATNVEENAVHGSDAPETACDEIAFFFPDSICARSR